MGRAFTPTLARIVHDGHEMRKALRGILGFVALIALPAGIGTSLVASDITLVLLGDQWTRAADFFRWLAICGAFESVLLVMESYFIARHRERIFTVLTMVQLATLVPAILWAGPHFGIEGIAIARTLVTGAAMLAMFTVMVRLGWLGWRDLAVLCWRPVLAAAAMAVVVTTLHDPSISVRLLSMLRDVALGGATYTAVLVGLWWLSGRPEGAEKSCLAVLRRVAA